MHTNEESPPCQHNSAMCVQRKRKKVYINSHFTRSHRPGFRPRGDSDLVLRKWTNYPERKKPTALHQPVIRSPDKHLSLIYARRVPRINAVCAKPAAFERPQGYLGCFQDGMKLMREGSEIFWFTSLLTWGCQVPGSKWNLHITFNYNIHRISMWRVVTPQEFPDRMTTTTGVVVTNLDIGKIHPWLTIRTCIFVFGWGMSHVSSL